MDLSFVTNAFGLVVSLSFPVVIGAIAGAIVMGFMQSVTQISDDVISYAGKFVGVITIIYLYSGHISEQVLSFTKVVWGSGQFY